MDLLGSSRSSSTFVFLQVESFRSTLLFISGVAVLLRWSYGALARRLPDCLLQQVLPGSDEGGAMTAARLRLSSVFVVVARWSTDLDVNFIFLVFIVLP